MIREVRRKFALYDLVASLRNARRSQNQKGKHLVTTPKLLFYPTK